MVLCINGTELNSIGTLHVNEVKWYSKCLGYLITVGVWVELCWLSVLYLVETNKFNVWWSTTYACLSKLLSKPLENYKVLSIIISSIVYNIIHKIYDAKIYLSI